MTSIIKTMTMKDLKDLKDHLKTTHSQVEVFKPFLYEDYMYFVMYSNLLYLHIQVKYEGRRHFQGWIKMRIFLTRDQPVR